MLHSVSATKQIEQVGFGSGGNLNTLRRIRRKETLARLKGTFTEPAVSLSMSTSYTWLRMTLLDGSHLSLGTMTCLRLE